MADQQRTAKQEEGAEVAAPKAGLPWVRGLLIAVAAVVAAGAGFWWSLYLSRPPEPDVALPPLPPLDAPQPDSSSSAGQPPAAPTAPGFSLDKLPDPADPVPQTAEGLLEEAKAVANALVEQFPNNADAHEVMARLEFRFGDTAKAVESWQRCLSLDPNYAYAYSGLGSVAARKGDYRQAVRHLRRALIRMPTSLRIQEDLADALINLGKLDEAIELLEAADPQPRSARHLVLLGMAYLQSQDYAKAKQSYEAAVAADPNHANAHYGLATACARLGLKEQAQKAMARFRQLRAVERKVRTTERNQYDDVQAIREDVAAVYADAGRIYLGQRLPQAAERIWRRAIRLYPKNVDCRQALAWLCRQQGRVEETIRLMNELAEIEPRNPTYLLEAARLQAATGRLNAAEKTLSQLCQRLPDDPAGPLALAQFYFQTAQKLDRASQLAQRAAEQDPQAAHYVLLAGIHQKRGDLPAALAALQEALRLEPRNIQYRQMYELLKEEQAEKSQPEKPEAQPSQGPQPISDRPPEHGA